MKSPMGWLTWIVIAIILGSLAMQLISGWFGFRDVPMSQVISVLQGDEKLKEVTVIDGEQVIQITTDAGQRIQSNWVGRQVDSFVEILQQRSAAGTLDHWVARNPTPGILSTLLYTGLPFLLLGIGFFVVMRMVNGGGSGGPLSFGKSKAKLASKDMPKTTFADVAGVDEAVEELQEIKEFLAEPAKFQKLGAKIPKGVLLYGPPGTGKTLLARAVAGGGRGAVLLHLRLRLRRDVRRRRRLPGPGPVRAGEGGGPRHRVHRRDRRVGRHRGAGMGGGHDEREQTLNQLLVEMDGFDVRGGVILIAATNRPDVLDPALLRPGRFDRQISVEAPDLTGRSHILQVHAVGKPLAENVDLDSIARRTPGFSGADLANVLNEAALLAARMNLNVIGQPQLDEAIDRVIAGPQKRTRLMNDRERLITAYHEGGHALVAAAMPGNDPVQKVTILPRGRALGYTMVMPDDDKYSHTRGELLDQMAYMMGGRAAEEMIFHDPTTGAQNDIEKATKVARAMVTQYGMSERVGAVQLGGDDSEPFMGMRGSQPSKDFSEASAAIIDEEVAKLINAAHQEAYDVLTENREVLDELVRQLFAKETLNKAEVAEVFKNLKRRDKRPAWTGSDLRIPSTIPPVEVPAASVTPEAQETPPGSSALALPGETPGSWAPPAPEDRR